MGAEAALAALVCAAGGTTMRPGQVVVGRRGDIVVDHPFVSREHVAVGTAAGESLIAADLGSTNGTWLRRGDRRYAVAAVDAADRTILIPGDRLETIGGVTLLVVPVESPDELVGEDDDEPVGEGVLSA